MANLSAIGKISSLARVYEIQQRISSIEKNFKIGGDFQATLDREIARQAEKIQSVGADSIKVLDSQPIDETAPAKSQKFADIPEVAQVAGIEAFPSFGATPINNPAADNFTDDDDGTFEIVAHTDKRFTNTDTESLIAAAARRNGVDSELVRAIATAESNLNQNAVSNVGAIGVMQLMPSTAANLGVNPYDERENIEGGARYIRQMLDQFNGNLPNAIAAYNAGPGAVQQYGGVPPFAETQNYVGRVMDLYVG